MIMFHHYNMPYENTIYDDFLLVFYMTLFPFSSLMFKPNLRHL
jgi:hypothetical protein